MPEKQNGRCLSPEDFAKLNQTIEALSKRGAVREDARDLRRVLKEPETWGLPRNYINSSQRVLKSFMDRPYLFAEDLQDTLRVLKKEEQFAFVDWEERMQSFSRRVRTAKRSAIQAAAVTVTAIGMMIFGNDAYQWYTYNNSPEVVAQRQAEEQQRQAQLKEVQAENQRRQEVERLVTEQKMTLGLTSSKIDTSGWRIKYAPIASGVDYQDTAIRKKIRNEGYISVSKSGVFGSDATLGITVNKYTRVADNRPGIRLWIRTKYGDNQNFVLRNTEDSEVDARVVVFEKVKDDEVVDTRYLKITPMETEPDSFQVSYMKKTIADNPQR